MYRSTWLTTAIAALLIFTRTAFADSVTRYHNDNGGTGLISSETVLTPANVRTNFGKLYSLPVDGQVYAQPLYASSVTVPGIGVRNVVYIATEHNSVYAFDADSSSPVSLWHISFGTPILCSQIPGCTRDLTPEIGITSTPVIDIARQVIFVVAETYTTGKAAFNLHALSLATGAEQPGSPVAITGQVPGTSPDGNGSVVPFIPFMHWQRAALMELNGAVYIAFGGHQDTPTYHGWIFGYDATSLNRVAITCTSPNAGYSGIWQGGAGLTADNLGNIYVATGNGVMSAPIGSDYGDSILQLDSHANLAVKGFFSPSNQVYLNSVDADLGAGGVLVVPGSVFRTAPFVIGAAKDGRIFSLNSAALGGYNPNGDTLAQEFQQGGHNFGGDVFFNNTLYTWGAGNLLRSYAFDGNLFTPSATSSFSNAYGYTNSPAMSVSSNGITNGIVWATWSSGGSASGAAYPGTLHALDASNVAVELWNSDARASDYAGSWAKWCPPTIADGKVYVATFDGMVNVFGLIPSVAGSPASISATAGTPQSATSYTAFATALQTTVKDLNSNPLSGVTVSFTAPAGSATASFAGSPTATAFTNASGIATAPALTANGQAGSYTLTASVAGVGIAANFSLTNLPAAPASVAATAGTPQSAAVNLPFTSALQATVKDAGNNLLSGVTVAFTVPAAGAGATFAGSATATALTNASGIATAPALTANSQTGNYSVTASITGSAASAVFNLMNTPPVAPGGPSLAGSGNSSAASISLTAEGSTDWIHWGDPAVNRKGGVTPQLSSFSVMGTGNLLTYINDPRPLTWTDGAPAPSSSNNTNGAYISLVGQGFSLTAPADTTPRVLTVHVGGWFSGATFTAHLSDGSAADFKDVNPEIDAQYDRNYTISYQAASPGQTITVSWMMTAGVYGNVTLNGAALTGSASTGVSAGALAGTPQSAAINTAFPTALQAAVTTGNNVPVSGVTVTFTAPSTGATATFGGSAVATAVTNVLGIATAPALTTGNQAGSYTVIASVAGVATRASFRLTNLPGTAASISAMSGTPQSAAVNQWFTTALQTVVKDVGNNPLSGVTVTFAAPSTGAGANFAGSATATAVTNAGGIAAISLAANSMAGSYTVTASAAGLATPASFNLTNIAGAAARITSTSGTPQSTGINQPFATALQATVKDAANNLLSGVMVTFTAPASGPGAAFSGSATATAVTNASAVATSPWLTANALAGSYTVTATVAGLSMSASFNLTNQPPAAASITATSGTPQSATVSRPFTGALQATVKDANNNPMSGVTVTFTAPATGPGATFGGSATTTAVTNAGGVASAMTLTANGQPGTYTVTATIAGAAPAATFVLTNTPAADVAGSIKGAVDSGAAPVNLTAEGISDWIHWGDATLNRKVGVTPLISNFTNIGNAPLFSYGNDHRPMSWTDGASTPTGTNNTDGLYVLYLGSGFSFTAPADLSVRTLTIHVGGWFCAGTLTARLSDGSAVDFVDTTPYSMNPFERNYTLTYNAALPGQTLTVSWIDTAAGGNLTLNAAALR